MMADMHVKKVAVTLAAERRCLLTGSALSILLWHPVCWPDIPSPTLSYGLGLRYSVVYLGCRRRVQFVLKGRQSLICDSL